ncbi:MAG TPA: hypothetical protein DCS82_06690 [Rhodospirillaceae bacterium]|nr:hypothetical protein [Rhodospirillaceae bacterium]HAT35384.1 hypothetical protein [Rhodospirillaceae bacterium]|tara:strand:- start:29 stop:271 length:243 start_codon:yes stop_codon:yes gene_type:complete
MLIFIIAWGFILLGILGILLPIMPGFIFLIIGLYLMSLESLWINRQLDRLGRRYPKFGEISDDARVRAQRILHRIFRDDG